MAIKYHNFQPVKKSRERHTIGGEANFTAKRGQVVVPKNDGTEELVLATGQAGFFLMRDIVSTADLTAAIKANEVPTNMATPDEFEYPYEEGHSAQAEDLEEFWVEGADLIDDLDQNTTVGTRVTTAAGKLHVHTDSDTDEVLGVITAVEAAKNAAAPAKRFRIQVMRAPVAIPGI